MNGVTVTEWVDVLRDEYLTTFIKDGGASVKFAVAKADTLADARDRVAQAAADEGFLVAHVDGLDVKAHLIQELYFAVARDIDWNLLARRVSEKAIIESNLDLDPGGSLTFDSIAAANNDAATFLVRNRLEEWFTKGVFRDYRMAVPFRLAMMRLCLEPMIHPDLAEGDLSWSLREWACGDLRQIRAVKPALIFSKITRENARDMFVSLAHWIHVAGFSGLVLTLDITSYFTRPVGDGRLPTRAAVLDLYETLRQFIDTTDELDRFMLVVLVPPEFVTDEGRGWDIYPALKARIADEVVTSRGNPLAALLRIQGDGENA